jgi:hypothetical protein
MQAQARQNISLCRWPQRLYVLGGVQIDQGLYSEGLLLASRSLLPLLYQNGSGGGLAFSPWIVACADLTTQLLGLFPGCRGGHCAEGAEGDPSSHGA